MAEVKYKKVTFPNFSEEEVNKTMKNVGEKGNIPAYLDLIMHNQGVINEKLNTLLGEKV